MASKEIKLVATGNLAKLYRTTGQDIEAKLVRFGLKPVRETIHESGRHYKLWDQDKALDLLNKYKAERLAMLQKRAEERKELLARQSSIPRTGYASPDVDTGFPSDFAPEPQEPEPQSISLVEMKLREDINELKAMVNKLLERFAESAPHL